MSVRRIWFVSLLLMFCASAKAELVVGGSFDDDLLFLNEPGFQLTFGAAVGFRPTETVFLDRVDFILRYTIEPPTDAIVELRSRFEPFEVLPGDLLESVTAPCTGCNSAEPELRSFDFSGTTRLEAGELYWIVFGTGQDGDRDILQWPIPVPIVNGPVAIRTVNGGFFLAPGGPADGILQQPAFRVVGTVVPVPPALLMFGSALFMLAGRGLKRRAGASARFSWTR